MSANQKNANAELVLASTLKNLQAQFGWSQERMASTLFVHRNQLQKLYNYGIDPSCVQGQIAVMLIRIFRGLVALIGNDCKNLCHWLNTKNKAFNDDTPQEKLSSLEGMVSVMQYLDAMRGKI